MEIHQQQIIANRDVREVDSQVQAAHIAAIGQATERLRELETWYRTYLWNVATPVFITGDSSKDANFIETLGNKYMPHVFFSVNEVYDFLTQETWKSFTPSGEFGTNQHLVFLSTLKELAMDLGIVQMEFPHFETGFFVRGEEELKIHLKRFITKIVGDDLAILYFTKIIFPRALHTHLNFYLKNKDKNEIAQFYFLFTDATLSEIESFMKIFTNKNMILEKKLEVAPKETEAPKATEVENTKRKHNK